MYQFIANGETCSDLLNLRQSTGCKIKEEGGCFTSSYQERLYHGGGNKDRNKRNSTPTTLLMVVDAQFKKEKNAIRSSIDASLDTCALARICVHLLIYVCACA